MARERDDGDVWHVESRPDAAGVLIEALRHAGGAEERRRAPALDGVPADADGLAPLWAPLRSFQRRVDVERPPPPPVDVWERAEALGFGGEIAASGLRLVAR